MKEVGSEAAGPSDPDGRSEIRRTTLLLVDDEATFRRLTARELERSGYDVTASESLAEARRALERQQFHLALVDIRLPDGSGLELLEEIRGRAPHTEVIMLTAYGTVQEAIQAMKQGAHDFLTKPCKLGELEAVLEKAVQKQSLVRGHQALQRDVERLTSRDHIVGQATQVRELLRMISRVAETM